MGTFPNNPRQCANPKTYDFRNVFERFSSGFESFGERFAPFSHCFAPFSHCFAAFRTVSNRFRTVSSAELCEKFAKTCENFAENLQKFANGLFFLPQAVITVQQGYHEQKLCSASALSQQLALHKRFANFRENPPRPLASGRVESASKPSRFSDPE